MDFIFLIVFAATKATRNILDITSSVCPAATKLQCGRALIGENASIIGVANGITNIIIVKNAKETI